MKKNKNKEEIKTNVLEVTAAMQGSLKFEDAVTLRINGKFNGSLETKGVLEVGRDAEVIADIKGEEVIVAGKVMGNIFANSLKLTSTGSLTGNIITKSINMDFGSYFDGKCEMGAKESKIENKSESLNETEMADYLNVDLFKVKEWVDNKKLPSEVLNGRDSFNKDKVDEWISKSKITE